MEVWNIECVLCLRHALACLALAHTIHTRDVCMMWTLKWNRYEYGLYWCIDDDQEQTRSEAKKKKPMAKTASNATSNGFSSDEWHFIAFLFLSLDSATKWTILKRACVHSDSLFDPIRLTFVLIGLRFSLDSLPRILWYVCRTCVHEWMNGWMHSRKLRYDTIRIHADCVHKVYHQQHTTFRGTEIDRFVSRYVTLLYISHFTVSIQLWLRLRLRQHGPIHSNQ